MRAYVKTERDEAYVRRVLGYSCHNHATTRQITQHSTVQTQKWHQYIQQTYVSTEEGDTINPNY